MLIACVKGISELLFSIVLTSPHQVRHTVSGDTTNWKPLLDKRTQTFGKTGSETHRRLDEEDQRIS